MKRLTAIVIAIAATLAFASSASAKGFIADSVAIYDSTEISASKGIFWGQLLTGNTACAGQRKFKFVAKGSSGSATLDKGRTSAEGGLSALVTTSDLMGATQASFVVAKSGKCGKVVGSIQFARQAASRAAGTAVSIAGVDGDGDDGAIGGFVKSSKGSCKANRKVKLLRNGRPIDKGTTTTHGAWSLHVTKAEFNPSNEFKVVVNKTSKCAGAKTVFDFGINRPSWR
ncbi:MAG: hypothetical protein U0R51_06030 [Solirubrobacterales bacterium]